VEERFVRQQSRCNVELAIVCLYCIFIYVAVDGRMGYNSQIQSPNNIQFADVNGDGIDGTSILTLARSHIYIISFRVLYV
jgi:hypothetical protein